MIAPITSPEIIKLAWVLALLVPAAFAGGVGFLYGACWAIGKLWRRGP